MIVNMVDRRVRNRLFTELPQPGAGAPFPSARAERDLWLAPACHRCVQFILRQFSKCQSKNIFLKIMLWIFPLKDAPAKPHLTTSSTFRLTFALLSQPGKMTLQVTEGDCQPVFS